MKRANALAIALTPALSFGTLAVALGLGANSETLAAVVYGAPPGASRSGLAWQVDVMYEDRGVREIKPNLPVAVHAEWKGNAREWRGVTTSEGAAEVPLDFPGIAPGDEVDVSISIDDHDKYDQTKMQLASGRARVPESDPWRGHPLQGVLPALLADGAIHLEVTIAGGKLAAEFPCELWVRAKDAWGGAIKGSQIHVDPAADLALSSSDLVTDDTGWAKVDVTSTGLTANITIHAKSSTIVGSWSGPLPVVLGATRAVVAQDDTGNLHANVARPIVSSGNAYVEIDDEPGRVFAQAVPLTPLGNDFARAVIDLPKLSAGNYWIVAASTPGGSESMPPGTFAIPFRVDDQGRAATTGELASYHARAFSRTLVLDGFLEARKISAERRRHGMTIAFASLVIGAFVEAVLLVRAARQGSSVKAKWITGTLGGVLIGIGMSLLGFALLAAFVATH